MIMGQKVNPFSLRLVNSKNWQSRWFSKSAFSTNVAEDLAIRDAISKKFNKSAGIAKVEILRDHESIKINLYSSKPGILIGRSGQGINDIRAYLVKHVTSFRLADSNKLPKIEIEILEVKTPETNAKIVGENIAIQIEKRIPYKRAIKQAIAKAIEAKAKGIKIQIAGRLGGAEIARSEKYGQNSVPLGRMRADIDFAHATALTTYGTVGIKVWIYKGDKISEE
jgi:small subunit ribosomal protein S3